MSRIELLPAIDIRGGRAVRLVHGEYDRETAYDADPLDAARRWVAGGARALHVVDLDGARSGVPENFEHVRRIVTAVEVPVQLGGGLRELGAVDRALGAGVDRVVIGTAAVEDRGFLREALARHGERIVVGVDARGGRAATEGWTRTSEQPAAELVRSLAEDGARRVVFTPIEVDGTMRGPGLEELRAVAATADCELVYSGGIGSLADLELLAREAPPQLVGVIVGRALYEGRFGVAEAIAALERG